MSDITGVNGAIRRETVVVREHPTGPGHISGKARELPVKNRSARSRLIARILDHPFMIGIDPDFVELLTWGAKEMSYERGDILFMAGEPADRFFLLEYGSVALEFAIPEDRHTSTQRVGSGEVVGWSWMTAPYRYTSDARVLQPTKAIIFDAAAVRQACRERPREGYRVLQRLMAVVANRLDAARSQLVDERTRQSVT